MANKRISDNAMNFSEQIYNNITKMSLELNSNVLLFLGNYKEIR